MLSDGVVTLRALEPADVNTLFVWENDPRVWSAGASLAPYSLKQLADYVENYDGNIYKAGQLRLMISLAENGETIGTLDFYDFDAANSRSGVGILIAPEYRRKGYGLRALALGEKFCQHRLSLNQLYSIVGEQNSASRALFERAGYSCSGRLRSWLRESGRFSDALIYQKISTLSLSLRERQ